MLLSAVSVLVVAQSSLEILEGLMNNPVYDVSFNKMGHAVATSSSNEFIVILMMFIVHNLYSFTRYHP